MSATVELRAFRNEAILSRILIHNSIERPHIIIGRGDHLAVQVELEAGLGDPAALLPARRDAPLQIKLARVLILRRLGVHAAHGDRVLAFVSCLRIIGCVRGRSGSSGKDL